MTDDVYQVYETDVENTSKGHRIQRGDFSSGLRIKEGSLTGPREVGKGHF